MLALIPTLALATAANIASPQPKAFIDPCSMLTNEQVFRIFDWNVTSKERKYRYFYSPGGYAYHRRGGWSCAYESSQGVIIVTVADANATFPGDIPFNDPVSRHYTTEVRGYPAKVVIFNGTAYISRHHHQVSVQVVSYDRMFSNDEIEPVVPIIVHEIP
jgi:hypothetical protein